MVIPPEQIVKVCRIGADEATRLLERARGGDLSCLANWTIFAAFRQYRRDLPGDPNGQEKAENRTVALFQKLDLDFRRVG